MSTMSQENDANLAEQSEKSSPTKKKNTCKTVYCVDGKPVHLNLIDRLRIKLMSKHEKQAFLAEKLLKQEKKG